LVLIWVFVKDFFGCGVGDRWPAVFLSYICLLLVSGQSWSYKIHWELFPLPLFSGKACVELVFLFLKWLAEFSVLLSGADHLA
jgi:hypothetical protein